MSDTTHTHEGTGRRLIVTAFVTDIGRTDRWAWAVGLHPPSGGWPIVVLVRG